MYIEKGEEKTPMCPPHRFETVVASGHLCSKLSCTRVPRKRLEPTGSRDGGWALLQLLSSGTSCGPPGLQRGLKPRHTPRDVMAPQRYPDQHLSLPLRRPSRPRPGNRGRSLNPPGTLHIWLEAELEDMRVLGVTVRAKRAELQKLVSD